MKRFHVNVTVRDLGQSISFYNTLFGEEPAVLKKDYAKCCYARSTKSWVRDPDDVARETFVMHGQITEYGNDRVPQSGADVTALAVADQEKRSRCCA